MEIHTHDINKVLQLLTVCRFCGRFARIRNCFRPSINMIYNPKIFKAFRIGNLNVIYIRD